MMVLTGCLLAAVVVLLAREHGSLLLRSSSSAVVESVVTATGDDSTSWPPTHVLDNIADNNKRLVVVGANYGYSDFADNFAASLTRLGVTNFVFVPFDGEAHRVLGTAWPEHSLPLPPGFSGDPAQGYFLQRLRGAISQRLGWDAHNLYSATFGTRQFKKMAVARSLFLKPFLDAGYTVFYNDIDMVWQQNAWNVLDGFRNKTTVLWYDGSAGLCSCLMYFAPGASSSDLLRAWERELEAQDPRKNVNQPALNEAVKRTGMLQRPDVAAVPNSELWPNGRMYFRDDVNATTRARAVIVHNNFIRGKSKKLERFVKHGLWHPSGNLPS
jgi:hypothetical protein